MTGHIVLNWEHGLIGREFKLIIKYQMCEIQVSKKSPEDNRMATSGKLGARIIFHSVFKLFLEWGLSKNISRTTKSERPSASVWRWLICLLLDLALSILLTPLSIPCFWNLLVYWCYKRTNTLLKSITQPQATKEYWVREKLTPGKATQLATQ